MGIMAKVAETKAKIAEAKEAKEAKRKASVASARDLIARLVGDVFKAVDPDGELLAKNEYISEDVSAVHGSVEICWGEAVLGRLSIVVNLTKGLGSDNKEGFYRVAFRLGSYAAHKADAGIRADWETNWLNPDGEGISPCNLLALQDLLVKQLVKLA
jgi:hypothetical protein